MKIAPLDVKPAATPAAADRRSPAAPAGAGPEPSARVELSSRAALGGADGSRAEFDSQKVERIAQAIRDGSFTIDAEAIADKLIANAQELLSRPGH
jgi:negative regulator of flagellin synthesis FlgM